jgi:hypothetical protein
MVWNGTGACSMKTHTPDGSKTYCGRPARHPNYDGKPRGAVCIDPRTTCLEKATCRACQRSDDRRVKEAYYREQMALPYEQRDGA